MVDDIRQFQGREYDKITNMLGREDWIGHLDFYYYGSESEPLAYTMPFFENPTITESQSANYQEYNPIGRAGSLYSYGGSPSRQVNLSFNLTLPVLLEHIRNTDPWTNPKMAATRQAIVDKMKSLAGQKVFFSNFKPGDDPIPALKKSFAAEDKVEKAMGGSFTNPEVRILDEFYEQSLDEADKALFSLRKVQSRALDGDGAKYRQAVIAKLANFIRIIRTTTTNHAQNPVYGPPVVRLNWGIMYENVPFITKSYDIEPIPDGGFDQRTLMPRQLRISMELAETRNVGKFSRSGDVAGRDNLGGWEVLIEKGGISTDPGYKHTVPERKSSVDKLRERRNG